MLGRSTGSTPAPETGRPRPARPSPAGGRTGVAPNTLRPLDESFVGRADAAGGPLVGSAQTLNLGDRRLVAAWAADCAERVLGLFEQQAPGDGRPRAAIARARTFARGELGVAEAIRLRFVGGAAADLRAGRAASAAARAAGQAAGVCHMGAHAFGAAAYAVLAVRSASPDRPEATRDEIRWQMEHMSEEVRRALRSLPPVGEDSAGPLGPGQLSSGELGPIVRELQAALLEPRPE